MAISSVLFYVGTSPNLVFCLIVRFDFYLRGPFYRLAPLKRRYREHHSYSAGGSGCFASFLAAGRERALCVTALLYTIRLYRLIRARSALSENTMVTARVVLAVLF